MMPLTMMLVVVPLWAQLSPRALWTQGKYGQARTAAERVLLAGEDVDARDVLLQARVELDMPASDAVLGEIEAQLGKKRERFGEASAEYGQTLLIRADARRTRGDVKSIEDYERARGLCAGRRELTCEAEAMRGLALVLVGRSRLEEAQKLNERAWELHRDRLGAEAPMTLLAYAQWGGSYLNTQIQRCGEMEEEAIGRLRKAVGPEHAYLGYALGVQGSVKRLSGDFVRAAPLFAESVRAYASAYGAEHRILVQQYNNWGLNQKTLGEFDEAYALLSKAVAIAEKRLGAEHPVTMTALGNLAIVQGEEGDLLGAWRTKERVVAIQRKLGRETMELASMINSVGLSLAETGDLVRARERFEESLGMLRRLAGAGNFKAIEVLVNVGNADVALGQTKKGLEELAEAVELARKHLGVEHTAEQTSAYGGALVKAGEEGEAEKYLLEAEAQMATQAPNSRRMAQVQQYLAELALRRRQWEEAERRSRRAIEMFVTMHDEDYYELHEAWSLLGEAQAGQGNWVEAVEAGRKGDRIRRRTQGILLNGLSERHAMLEALQQGRALQLLTTAAVKEPKAVEAAWDAVVRSRALVLDAVASRLRQVRTGEDAEMARQWKALSEARARLARAVVRGRGALTAAAYKKQVGELQAEADQAEGELAARSAVMRGEVTGSKAGFAQVAAALPAQMALVGYVSSAERYVAFVLPRSGARAVAMDLGAKAVVEGLVGKWRAEIEREMGAGGQGKKVNEQRVRAAGEALRRVIWDPVAKTMGLVHGVLVVPDGVLALVNFAALPAAAAGKYLVETGPAIHALTAERDLLVDRGQPGKGLLAVGDPAFGRGAGGDTEQRRCGDLGGMRFEALPGSAVEARSLAGYWTGKGSGPATLLLGESASEAAVKKAMVGKWGIHLATHGYFGGKECEGNRMLTQNPMMLAGFALAGANVRGRGADEDGMLLAAEIAGLNLEGTRWAVLSGCDTGTGQVMAGEGVLGLRRAFQTAGVGTVIASLWPVEDGETRAWMGALYRAHLAGQQGTMGAVRAAQRARLEARRKAGESTHPFYWAGFVAMGDWR